MLFNRTYHLHSPYSENEIKQKLKNNHVNLHNLDFEVIDKEHHLKVIPHAENNNDLKTLPITNIRFSPNGSGSKVKLNFHMRRIDAGGPILLTIFCFIAMLAGIALYLNNKSDIYPAVGIFGLGFIIFVIFWFRMEKGYFDYIRKIKAFIKQHIK